MYLVVSFMILSGLLVFCSLRSHLLLTLLGLEFMVLSMFLLLFLFLTFYDYSYYFLLVFMVFSVCEGVVGLGILVSMIRSHGNDTIMSLSILGW